FKEQLRFLAEPLAQIVVEVRKQIGIGQDVRNIAQMQPLAREIRYERFRFGIRQHAANLGFEYRRITQRSLDRCAEQLIVRNAAPKEKRKPRSEFDIADAMDRRPD